MIIQRKLEELKKSTVTIYVTGVTGMITTKGEHLQFPYPGCIVWVSILL